MTLPSWPRPRQAITAVSGDENSTEVTLSGFDVIHGDSSRRSDMTPKLETIRPIHPMNHRSPWRTFRDLEKNSGTGVNLPTARRASSSVRGRRAPS